jgi:hypothetical protein
VLVRLCYSAFILLPLDMTEVVHKKITMLEMCFKNGWISPPICLHGVNGSNVTFGKEDSINISNIWLFELPR